MTAQTLIEKILSTHAGREVHAGEIVEVALDSRVARDFGGASVVGHLERLGLELADPGRTFFTFDCNPAGSDQKYAANQHRCRMFARQRSAGLLDVGSGIGTHLAVDTGMAWPGSTLVSTDSHANILGAIGAFGQGMGDIDVAAAMAQGRIWFEVPATVRVILVGRPGPQATAKDIALRILQQTGADGLLGCAAEISGEVVNGLGLDARMTIASMGTEMGAITLLFAPSSEVLAHCGRALGREVEAVAADPDANGLRSIEVDIEGLAPLVSRPGHPEDVVALAEVRGTPIDAGFIGSCTNGRIEDLRAAARVLDGHRVAPGVVLKIVPATDAIWQLALAEGLLAVFKRAGALVSSAGCAGCAEGQVGQNGPGEVTVSTGNRNFSGKQGKGQVWLASPATAAASAILGAIHDEAEVARGRPVDRSRLPRPAAVTGTQPRTTSRPHSTLLEGRVFVIPVDGIDTDMIFHNRHLAITEPAKMAPHAFGNLAGYEHFPTWVEPGDLVWVGANFGCGSSRQQAVDALMALGVQAVIGRSFGAIYWRNAVNAGLPVLTCDEDLDHVPVRTGDRIRIDLASGRIELLQQGQVVMARPLGAVPLGIVQRGGLLVSGAQA